MKVKIKTKEEVKFETVTFEVTVETLDELISLWMQLNIPSSVVELEHSNYDSLPKFIEIARTKDLEVDTFQFFSVVDDFVEQNEHKLIKILEKGE